MAQKTRKRSASTQEKRRSILNAAVRVFSQKGFHRCRISDIASEAGLTCGIVGWWATWPADPVNGFLISDYVAWHSFGVTGRESVDTGKTWPPEMMEKVAAVMPPPEF